MKVFLCKKYPNLRVLVRKEEVTFNPEKGQRLVAVPPRYAEFKNGRFSCDDKDNEAIESLRGHKDFNILIHEVSMKALEKQRKEDKKEKTKTSTGDDSGEPKSDGKKYTRGMQTAE